ncbi:MAG: hypothetical protein U1F15_01550 [Burkholderiales bacterium]
MNRLQSTFRGWLVWLVPFAVLALVILWQVDWGRAFLRSPPPDVSAAPKPVTLSILPDYQPAASPDVHRDAVERTLFNPTRRPAPSAVAEAAKPRMQRGQFTLAGTLQVDGKSVAFLREVNGGKSRRVAQGDSINGLMVSEVRTDRVRLTLGDESEELALKIAVGPRSTIQPVMAGGPVSASAAPAGPVAAGAAAPRDVADVLAERRRAARAAEAAAQGATGGSANPVAANNPVTATNPNMAPPPSAAPSTDPQWQEVYRRYQQQRR